MAGNDSSVFDKVANNDDQHDSSVKSVDLSELDRQQDEEENM